MAQEADEIVSARIPASWAKEMDRVAAGFEKKMGTTFNRSAVVRMALARYLGFVEDTKDQRRDASQPIGG